MAHFTSSSRGTRPLRATAPRPPMSPHSSPRVFDSGWSSENFMLGAGMVIIQPSTHKLVLIYDTELKYWFLPRGRKDIGESLETTALREAYEESGYRVTFLPLFTPTHAPSPPSDPSARRRSNTESLYTTVTYWAAGRGNRRVPGEYMTFWYAGQIPHDAVYETGTGMPNEQMYTSHLLTYPEVMERLWGLERRVMEYVWTIYLYTLSINDEVNEAQAEEAYVHVEGVDDSDEDGVDFIVRENESTNTSAPLRANAIASRTIVDLSHTQPPRRNPESSRTIVDSRVAQPHHPSRPISYPPSIKLTINSKYQQYQYPPPSSSDSSRDYKRTA